MVNDDKVSKEILKEDGSKRKVNNDVKDASKWKVNDDVKDASQWKENDDAKDFSWKFVNLDFWGNIISEEKFVGESKMMIIKIFMNIICLFLLSF